MKKKLAVGLFSLALMATVAVPTIAKEASVSIGSAGTAILNVYSGGASAGTYSNILVDRITVNVEDVTGKSNYGEDENSRGITKSISSKAKIFYSQHKIEQKYVGTDYKTLKVEL